MKNKYFFIAFFVLIVSAMIYTLSFQYNIKNMQISSQDDKNKNDIAIIPGSKPKYHFSLIYDNVDSSNWTSIKKGVQKASKKYNVAVELKGTKSADIDKTQKYLEMAIASKVDGIATVVTNQIEMRSIINNGVNKSIPIVTIQNDCTSKRSSFIGVDYIEAGEQLGQMVSQLTKNKKRAVVLTEKNDDSVNTRDMVKGIKNSLKGSKIEVENYTYRSIVDIEQTIKELISKRSDLKTIVLTNERDTMIVTEKLVDLYKLNYKIIGYGRSDAILHYIENGIISGTISPDFEQMGYDAIRSLVEIKEKNEASRYYKVKIRKIEKKNINDYLKSGDK